MGTNSTSLDFGMEDDAYPLTEAVVSRSGIAVFESQLSSIAASSPDCEFLSGIAFGTCFYGASDFPIYPFVCVPKSPLTGVPTAAHVLAALHIANFQSEHIGSLDTTRIAYPGYQPGTKNDEIHTDPGEQYMFAKTGNEDADSTDEMWEVSRASHEALRDYVLERHLFYVLVHDTPKPHDGFLLSDLVLLFAVGVSAVTGHLIGAVSSQVCHNLCD